MAEQISLERYLKQPGDLCDLLFGRADSAASINANNSILKFICRAHELVLEGLEFLFDKVVTVLSNYCYYGNTVSILVSNDVNMREPKLPWAVTASAHGIPPRT
ncbi:hypothetical protein A6R68_15811, partial [Neotoma lepida]